MAQWDWPTPTLVAKSLFLRPSLLKKGIEAYGLKVGQLAKATKAFFAGPLNLQGAKIGGELRADVH